MNFNGLRNCFESSSLRASTQNSDRHFKIHLNFYMSPNIRNSAVYPSYENKYTALFYIHQIFYQSLYNWCAAINSSRCSVNTRIQFSILSGRITTWATSPAANAYIYSIKTFSSERYPNALAKAPGVFGQLRQTTPSKRLRNGVSSKLPKLYPGQKQ